jgi:CTP-dependent riboflavin kinase
VQAGFVDDPRRAVEDADALVAETMQRLAETFSQERKRLEQEFARQPAASGTAQSGVGTEELRIALRHYRSFFKRLLSV